MIVESQGLPQDAAEFASRLSESLKAWTADGIRLVWLDVPLTRAALVPVAVDAGFGFHHADEDSLTLTRRLVREGILVTV